MVKRLSNKKIILAFVLLVAVVVGGFFAYSVMTKEDVSEAGFTEIEEEDPFVEQEVQELLTEYNNDLNQRKDAESGSVNSPEDLSQIEDSNLRGQIGFEKAYEAYGSGDVDLANAYLDALMADKDQGYALEAAVVCYEFNQDEDIRSQCRDNANEAGILQGALEEGETFPDFYFEPPEEIG